MAKTEFETYGDPTHFIERLVTEKPSALNNIIRVQRYRITVELIEEPKEVLKCRLLELSNEGGHIDRRKRIRAAASKLGITLD